METHLKIGKSILKKYSEFADKNTLDDENEYFPAFSKRFKEEIKKMLLLQKPMFYAIFRA